MEQTTVWIQIGYHGNDFRSESTLFSRIVLVYLP